MEAFLCFEVRIRSAWCTPSKFSVKILRLTVRYVLAEVYDSFDRPLRLSEGLLVMP